MGWFASKVKRVAVISVNMQDHILYENICTLELTLSNNVGLGKRIIAGGIKDQD